MGIMKFLEKLRLQAVRFMAGRNGIDEIVTALLWVWPALYILGLLTRVWPLLVLADAAMIYMVFRMLSKNVVKRRAEAAAFSQKTAPWRRKIREYAAMAKNYRKYAYFSCPKCKAKLRVPRGVGNVTVTCKHCGNRFDKKA
jgi:ribosomal protein L37AE/L43A